MIQMLKMGGLDYIPVRQNDLGHNIFRPGQGEDGICLLTGLMDIATANNTVAIVIAAPIAKEISQEYNVEPRKVASLLDTCSCIFQGIIPYGAQLLVAASLSGISSMAIMPYLHYQFLLAICVVISILVNRSSAK